MEHVVFYTAADGSPAYRRTANLDDAVRVVEHLRNAEGREEVHVYSLASVALNFRPYYRVELNSDAPIPPPADGDAGTVAFTAPVPIQQVPDELAALEQIALEAVPEPFQPMPPAPPQYAAPVAEQADVPAPPAAPTPDPVGAFMPMAPIAAPMPPAPEQSPAMAGAAETADSDEATEQNGQGRTRSLGFFTR